MLSSWRSWLNWKSYSYAFIQRGRDTWTQCSFYEWKKDQKKKKLRNCRRRKKKKKAMALAGLYRRSLPSPPAIEFASPDGKVSFSFLFLNKTPNLFIFSFWSLSLYFSKLKSFLSEFFSQQLFKEALDRGTAEGFFKLISYYQTQSEPAYCGLATLSMVLNALAIDPGRTWKGHFFSFFFSLN